MFIQLDPIYLDPKYQEHLIYQMALVSLGEYTSL